VAVNVIVNVKMGIVMNNLSYDELKKIYKGFKNLGDKPIIIDFYADWCGPCKMFEPIFEKVGEEYKDKVDFYKVDSEEHQDLAYMFQIRSIPTLVMIPLTGETIINPGSMNESTLKYFVEGLISKK